MNIYQKRLAKYLNKRFVGYSISHYKYRKIIRKADKDSSKLHAKEGRQTILRKNLSYKKEGIK